MPNHIQNIINIKGDIEKFLSAVKSDESEFDFNNIIPRPELIKLPDKIEGIPSCVSEMAELVMIYQGWPVYDYNGKRKSEGDYINYGYQHKWEDSYFQLFERCCKAIMQTGFSNWWPWSVFNWGTKWNAYAIKIERETIRFQTAWNTPERIWAKIAEKFPNTVFDIKYADEDYGANCGEIKITDGHIKHTPINTESFAYKVWERNENPPETT